MALDDRQEGAGGRSSHDHTPLFTHHREIGMALVKVYFGKTNAEDMNVAKQSRRMGTISALAEAKLRPLKESERIIDDTHLDARGFWMPAASARGDEK